MIKDVLAKQKYEMGQLLAQNYVTRDKTLQAESFVDNDLVKVVIGPRRAGKSVFSMHLFKNKGFAYINFDDENLVKTENYDDILKEMLIVYGETRYLFFDEVQNMGKWELFINRLHRQGYNILLTGSNAKLLSRELSTHLTGRHIPIEILPFNFGEFLKAKGFRFQQSELTIPGIKAKLLTHMESYLFNGGYPEIVVKGYSPRVYLDTLLDSVLLKDIVNRYKVRFPQKIYDLEMYLLNNVASEISYRKLMNLADFNSVATLEKYLKYLEEAYLVFILSRYSNKTVERLKSPKKLYLVDNGYVAAKAVQFSPNNGKLMENLVFMELLKKGFRHNRDLFYYKTRNNKEVDFIIRENLKVRSLIQVVYKINDPVTKEREINAIVEAGGELGCNDFLIVTWDCEEEISIKENKVRLIPLWKWLLNS